MTNSELGNTDKQCAEVLKLNYQQESSLSYLMNNFMFSRQFTEKKKYLKEVPVSVYLTCVGAFLRKIISETSKLALVKF